MMLLIKWIYVEGFTLHLNDKGIWMVKRIRQQNNITLKRSGNEKKYRYKAWIKKIGVCFNMTKMSGIDHLTFKNWGYVFYEKEKNSVVKQKQNLNPDFPPYLIQ